MKILGLGNALVDILATLKDETLLSSLHLAKGDMQMIGDEEEVEIAKLMQTLPHKMATGGSSANAMLALAHLQSGVGYMGYIGADENGKFFRQALETLGVETRLTLCEKPTGTANTFITPDGERTFATYLGAASMLTPNMLKREQMEGYDLVHIEGYFILCPGLLEAACRMAKEVGLKVSVDLSSYSMVAERRTEMTDIVKKYVDIVFANEEEATAFTQENDPRKAAEAIAEMCHLAVVKMGGKGSCAKYHGEELVEAPSRKVNLVDTTAAGDFFAGGFLHGYSQGWSLTDCMNAGASTAAMVIQVIGTQVTPQMWDELHKTLSTLS